MGRYIVSVNMFDGPRTFERRLGHVRQSTPTVSELIQLSDFKFFLKHERVGDDQGFTHDGRYVTAIIEAKDETHVRFSVYHRNIAYIRNASLALSDL